MLANVSKVILPKNLFKKEFKFTLKQFYVDFLFKKLNKHWHEMF